MPTRKAKAASTDERKTKCIRLNKSLELQIYQHLLSERAQGRSITFSGFVEKVMTQYLEEAGGT